MSTNRHGKRVSEACAQGKHAECTETYDTCACTYRGLHKTLHAYATQPVPPLPVHPNWRTISDCPQCGEFREHDHVCAPPSASTPHDCSPRAHFTPSPPRIYHLGNFGRCPVCLGEVAGESCGKCHKCLKHCFCRAVTPAPPSAARQPHNPTDNLYALDEFWEWAEKNAVNGALRIDEQWRVDEVAVAFAASREAALQQQVNHLAYVADKAKEERNAAEAALAEALAAYDRVVLEYGQWDKKRNAELTALQQQSAESATVIEQLTKELADKYSADVQIQEMAAAQEADNAALRAEVEQLTAQQDDWKQQVAEAVALRDKWINYAFVGEAVPPLAGNRKPELRTEIEKLRESARINTASARAEMGEELWMDSSGTIHVAIRELRATVERLRESLKIAVESYDPISTFLSELADKYDYDNGPDSRDPLHRQASDLGAHIAGTNIAIEQALGGDPEQGLIKLKALLAVAALAATPESAEESHE